MPEDQGSVKRRSERRLTLVIEGDEAEYLGDTVDLSTHGLCLQSEAPLALGQHVGLLLGIAPNYFIKARVVWVGKVDAARPGPAGIEFLNLLPGSVC